MDELMDLIAASKAQSKALEELISETKSEVRVERSPEDPKKKPKKKTDMIDINQAKKVIQKNDPVISFAKSQRFKSPKQDELMQASVMSNESHSTVASVSSLDAVKNKPATIVFPKAPRFNDDKNAVVTEYNLNPNFEVTKKKFPGIVIKDPTPKDMKVQIAKKLQTGLKYAKAAPATATIEVGKENAAAPVLEDVSMTFSDILSDTTIDSIGPGAYNPNYAAVETQKSVGFSRSGRFQETKPLGNNQEINPSYNAVWKAAPGVKIAKNVPVNEQLRRKRQIEDEMIDLRNRLRNQTSLERDGALKKNVPRVVMRPEFAGLDPRQRFARMLRILQQREEARKIAPGYYEPKEQDEPICLVAYRQSLSPKVYRLPERPPSPTRYYAKDDLIRPSPPAFFFNKEGIEVKVKYEDFDLKKPLDIKFDLVKPRIPNAVVLPEHKEDPLPDLEDIKMGPGKYDPGYKLVERRPDVGIMKMQDLTDKNMRENQMDMANKEAVDVDLNINYDLILPHHPEWKIHSPVKLDGPAHIPDSVLNPERFRFYDVNLDAIKPDMPDITLAGGLTRDEYLKREDEMTKFLGKREFENKMPDPGHYNVKYDAIDKELNAVDFGRYPDRGLEEPIEKDREIEGDVLILNPEQPKPHMPNIQFDKFMGREENKKDDDFREELILEPNYNQIDPKTVVLVNMNKQLERKDPYEKKVDPTQEELILQVNYDAIDPKMKNVPDFEKQLPRKEVDIPDQDEVILNPNYDILKPEMPKISFPKEKRSYELKKDDGNDGKITTEQQIQMEQALSSIKAKSPSVHFDSYAKRDNVKEEDKKKLLALKKKEEEEKIMRNKKLNEIEEEKGEVFEKYESSPKANKSKVLTMKDIANNKKPPIKKPSDRAIKKQDETKQTKPADNKLTKSEIEPWDNKKPEADDDNDNENF